MTNMVWFLVEALGGTVSLQGTDKGRCTLVCPSPSSPPYHPLSVSFRHPLHSPAAVGSCFSVLCSQPADPLSPSLPLRILLSHLSLLNFVPSPCLFPLLPLCYCLYWKRCVDWERVAGGEQLCPVGGQEVLMEEVRLKLIFCSLSRWFLPLFPLFCQLLKTQKVTEARSRWRRVGPFQTLSSS